MLATLRTPGFSNEAQMIARAAEEQNHHLRKSAALGNQDSFNDLAAVWEECRYPNWDGYQAHAVTQDTLRNTYRLLESLPLGSEPPTIGAEPDGELSLEWHRSPRRTLSVSITDDGYLHFAGIFGPNRINGTSVFFGDVPQDILQLIDRVCGT